MAGTKKGNKGKGQQPAMKKGRFGQPGGNKPFGNRDYHPMNMRAALRHLACQPLDPQNLNESFNALLSHHKFSGAEIAAYKRLGMAIGTVKDGDNHAIDKLEESLCGKVPDHNIIEAGGKQAEIPDFTSDAEALQAWKNDIKGT